MEKMTQSLAQSVGVDISKAHFDAHLYPAGDRRQFANTPTGVQDFLAWLAAWPVERIVFEATGAYHRLLERGAQAWPLVKVNPRRARRFAEAAGALAKTDRIDAAMLARFGAVLQPDIRPLKSEALAELTELAAARRGLTRDRTALMNRAKTLTIPLLKQQNARRLAQIENQIKAIDTACRARIAADPALARRRDILTSIAGVGEITASLLIADMPELGQIEQRQIASLAGLAPVTRQSGKWQGKSSVHGGRAQIRQALYMPALVAVRFNPDMKAKYQQLIKAGKPAKVAITAIMRKLVVLANALIKANRLWQTTTA